MKYRSLVNAYEQIEAQYPHGESFGIKKGNINADRPDGRVWFRVVEETPEEYRSIAYENGGLRLANVAAALDHIVPVQIKSNRSLQRSAEYCNAVRFLGSLTEIDDRACSISVAGLFIAGVQRESMLRVIEPHRIAELFPLQQIARDV